MDHASLTAFSANKNEGMKNCCATTESQRQIFSFSASIITFSSIALYYLAIPSPSRLVFVARIVSSLSGPRPAAEDRSLFTARAMLALQALY